MAANSNNSRLSTRLGTLNTLHVAPTVLVELEILQQSLLNVINQGVPVTYFNQPGKLVMVLGGINVCAKCNNLRLFEQMSAEKPDLCQHCAQPTTERKEP